MVNFLDSGGAQDFLGHGATFAAIWALPVLERRAERGMEAGYWPRAGRGPTQGAARFARQPRYQVYRSPGPRRRQRPNPALNRIETRCTNLRNHRPIVWSNGGHLRPALEPSARKN